MRILVGVCIIILALLGCYLPDKQEQAVRAFFDENSPQSSDMGSNEIVTEGIFANLKLYVAEHRLLIDIKETLISLKDPNYRNVPPVGKGYNEENFNKFFLDLGSERSKELIKLFGRIKNDRNLFEKKVSLLFYCIEDNSSNGIDFRSINAIFDEEEKGVIK
ncbi:P52 family lipoprotein [Borreliella afzelii]|uniref:P52 family lipoprotein n=1 Tax=Borreliella afzelii TaxID=29518 RepID=UPI003AF8A744